jgi:hypothetical protein
VPRINIKICIVGKGFERYKKELELGGKVEVIGAVDSLAEWYLKAHFVIAPILTKIKRQQLQHVPDRGEHLVRYYGWYSNRSRGDRNLTVLPLFLLTQD